MPSGSGSLPDFPVRSDEGGRTGPFGPSVPLPWFLPPPEGETFQLGEVDSGQILDLYGPSCPSPDKTHCHDVTSILDLLEIFDLVGTTVYLLLLLVSANNGIASSVLPPSFASSFIQYALLGYTGGDSRAPAGPIVLRSMPV